VDLDLLYDRATTITHADLSGLVPTAATVVLRDAKGNQVQAPAVTLSTISTHCDPSSTATVLKPHSTTGMKVGQPLAVVSQGETYVVVPALVTATDVHLEAGLPQAPSNNDPIYGLTMTASIAALGIGALGPGYQIEWRYQNATTKGYASVSANCVRWLWQPPITASEIAELLASVYQTSRSEEFCRGVAERVNTKVRNAIEQTGRRPYLYVSPGAFAEVAQVGARWVLADMGVALLGDIATLVREYRYAFGDELEKCIAGLKAYDATNTANVENERPRLFSIQVTR
jgi:hypothetical protein